MKRLTIIMLFIGFILSCKKNDDSSCKTDTASIAGSYKITAVTYKANSSSSEMDYFNILFPDACDRDNVTTLNANGTYLLKDAGVVCSPPDDDNGTWSSSATTMNVDGDIYIIESFNCKTLILSITDVQTTGDKLKITLTRQ